MTSNRVRSLVALTLVATSFIVLQPIGLGSFPSQNAAPETLSVDQVAQQEFFDKPNERPLVPGVTRVLTFAPAPNIHPLDYEQYVAGAVCSSELVVVGQTIDSRAFLTRSRSFIFTDYAFSVEEAIKGGIGLRSNRPTASSDITIGMVGGKILLDGQETGVAAEPLLDLRRRYVMFLKAIPRTSAYQRAGSVFKIDGGNAIVGDNRDVPDSLRLGTMTAGAFLADIRSAASRCGKAAR